MYLGSFTGYFPTKDPIYSLIITINNPRVGGYYGILTAGPVFKEISEKVFAVKMVIDQIHEKSDELQLPEIKTGRANDILTVAEELELENIRGLPATQLARAKKEQSQIVLNENEIAAGTIPNVMSIGASNASFIMENAGLLVRIKGIGKVQKQSIQPGSNYRRGQTVYLTLG